MLAAFSATTHDVQIPERQAGMITMGSACHADDEATMHAGKEAYNQP